jgi:hypothetical protein
MNIMTKNEKIGFSEIESQKETSKMEVSNESGANATDETYATSVRNESDEVFDEKHNMCNNLDVPNENSGMSESQPDLIPETSIDSDILAESTPMIDYSEYPYANLYIEDIDEWYEVQLKIIGKYFSKEEWCFLLDQFNGIYVPIDSASFYSEPECFCAELESGFSIDGYNKKWKVSRTELYKKIYSQPIGNLGIVAVFINHWWMEVSETETLESFLNQLLNN